MIFTTPPPSHDGPANDKGTYMTMRHFLLAGAAAMALGACGGEDGGAEGGAASNTSTKSVVSGGSPISKPFSLKNASELDVDALFALAPADARPTYQSVFFDEKLGATVVTGLQFTEEDGGTITIEKAELYGVDVDAIQRINAAEPAVDAPFETVFEKVRLFGINPEGADDDIDITIEALELDKLRIRQGGVDETQDSPAFFFNTFELGGFFIKNMSMTGGAEGSTIDGRIPDLRISGLGGGKMGALVIKDVAYDVNQSDEAQRSLASLMGPQGALIMDSPLRNFIAPGAQRASIKSVVWRGLDMSGLMKASLSGDKPSFTAKNLVKLGAVEIEGAQSYVDGKLASSSKKTTVTSNESTWIVPTKLRAESTGDFYNFSAYVPDGEEALLQIVKDNGLDNVKASSQTAWDWDAEGGDVALSTTWDTQGFADVSFDVNLNGIEIDKIAAAAESGDNSAIERIAVFDSFSMKIADDKMLDAIFAIAGLQMNSSASDLRESAPAMIRLGGAAYAGVNPRFSDYIDAFAAFIADGGALEVTANPSSPVPLAAIAETSETAPQDLPDIIDLKITHSK